MHEFIKMKTKLRANDMMCQGIYGNVQMENRGLMILKIVPTKEKIVLKE